MLEEKIILEQQIDINSLPKKLTYDAFKRLFDLIISIVAFVVAAIPLAVIALAVKISDGGTALYVQQRIGRDGKPFNIYKFRTMKMNADSLEDILTEEEYEQYKKEYKLENDVRVTKIGKFLRKASLDELPQLLNIIKGDMSIVGPRPLLEEETYLYGECRSKLLSVKPGLTGYWQAYARNTVGYENGERQKMELHYVDKRSMMFDIKIIFATVVRVLNGKGAQ